MKKIYPQILRPDSFKENLSGSTPDLYSKKRKPTDVCFFTVFILFYAVLFCFIGYCIYYGDISRVIYGYDDCGTVCGKTRKVDENNPMLKQCYSKTKESFGGTEIFNRCIPPKALAESISHIKNFFFEAAEDLRSCWPEMTYLCLIALGLSLGVLVLFRYLVSYVVWVILVGVAVASMGTAVSLWFLWANKKYIQEIHTDTDISFYLALAIAATIVSIIVVVLIFFMRKKIQLVIELFKEAGKAAATMPDLFFQPIMTFLTLAVALSVWLHCCLWIGSSGYLTWRGPNVFYYHKDEVMKITGALNFVGMIWIVNFIIGCQHMVIAGAVSKWYFTRNKSEMSSPISESLYNLIRYHLGSVAVGCFLITIIQIIRSIVTFIRKILDKDTSNSCCMAVIKTCLCLCDACLQFLEQILQIVTRNAYIIVAMYGDSFCKAGRKAFNTLLEHPLKLAAINSVGDFVLFLAKVLIVVSTIAAGSYLLKDKPGIQHLWVPLSLSGLFSYFISHCFISVYEMTIDTIFICFCEDCKLNDGLSKPYYMSRGLMKFVENSEKVLKIEEEKQNDLYVSSAEMPSLSREVDLQKMKS